MFFWRWGAPRNAWKNTACLVTYLIAAGHHLCVRFPLLVFQAQTRLISWLALIRGHISEHSRVSGTACWEKWNAINQSGHLFNVLDSGNKWLNQWCSLCKRRYVPKILCGGVKHSLICCINTVYIHSRSFASQIQSKCFHIFRALP